MFEVGKKYKSENVEGLIIEVLHTTDRNAFSRIVAHQWPNYVGVEVIYSIDKYPSWVEYKEPRTITRWINVYEHDGELANGAVYKDEETAIKNGKAVSNINNTYLDTISFSYTEPH